jgi:sulfotransferase
MPQKAHFISELLLSGSTLLAAILRKNPRFHAAMTSPVGVLVKRMWEAMSEDTEFSVFISPEQKRARILSIFSAYYHPQADKEIIFDTNRLWCSKLPLIRELFPLSKVSFCVRNIPWIIDCIELVTRRNPFDVSRLFNNPAERATVYSRTETLSQGSRLVGYAYNALKEAFYSEKSASILLVYYELLTIKPGKTMSLIYQFIGEEPFNHDFDNVQSNKEPEFYKKQKTKGLHQMRGRVDFKPRKAILLPHLFELFDGRSFWV